MMDQDSIFIDTWGWLALGHRRDPHHADVRRIYQDLHHRHISLFTTDHVLDELITLLFRRESFDEAVRFMEGVFAAVEKRQLFIERVSSDRFTAAWELRKRFQDKPKLSFTDLLSMVIMRERRIEWVLTEDEHFIQVGMGFRRVP